LIPILILLFIFLISIFIAIIIAPAIWESTHATDSGPRKIPDITLEKTQIPLWFTNFTFIPNIEDFSMEIKDGTFYLEKLDLKLPDIERISIVSHG